MTPDRIGLPSRPQSPAAENGDVASGSSSARATAAIVVMLSVLTVVHLFTPNDVGSIPLHLLYRRLYFVPIVFAAWVFGKRGGLLAAIGASVPFGIHARISLDTPLGMGFDNALEIASYLAVGLLFGAVRDVEESRTRDLRQVSMQLEEAYKKLEERAIQLINVQDYTSSILRSITSAVLTVGPDASVATANPAAERMLGISEFDMVPKPIGMLFRDDGGLSSDVSKVLAGRLPLALRDATLVTSSGQEIHVQASTSRMRAVGGTVLGAVVTLEDVSDIRALTDQLIRADRLAADGRVDGWSGTRGSQSPWGHPSQRAASRGLTRRFRENPRGSRRYQAGDRSARQGHQGVARLRKA
jgi:PAS domain S-box-containing protein